MLNFVTGKLKEVYENKIVVECGGVGFEIFFPASNIKNLPNLDSDIQIFTYMHVKEDEISLYGFLTREDKSMFLKLLLVSGVGPKGALNIISNLGFSTLMKAISNEDSELISSVSGIGKKTASKICIELGDKIRKMNFEGKIDIIKNNKNEEDKVVKVKADVVEALTKLGYKESKAREIISKVEVTKDMTASELLKFVLKEH